MVLVIVTHPGEEQSLFFGIPFSLVLSMRTGILKIIFLTYSCRQKLTAATLPLLVCTWRPVGRFLEKAWQLAILRCSLSFSVSCYCCFKLGNYFGGPTWAIALLLFGFADPVLTSQAILVSPDVVLTFLFLLAFYSILRDRKNI